MVDSARVMALVLAESLTLAITGAATLAAGFGGTGVAVAIGLSVAHNSIGNDVSSFITRADTGVSTTTGAISVTATENSDIFTTSTAAADPAFSCGQGRSSAPTDKREKSGKSQVD